MNPVGAFDPHKKATHTKSMCGCFMPAGFGCRGMHPGSFRTNSWTKYGVRQCQADAWDVSNDDQEGE